ncbi:MAG: LacI family DNA-binding transcriptional regulator [Granulosicoccus sp.]
MNLKQLSEHLGLSQTTVSRALNGYPEVSEKTRLRVAAAARHYNYRPNARATGLATGKASAIGHVIPVLSRDDVVNPIFGEFMAGASSVYSANGYELMLTVAHSENEADIYHSLKAKGAVDGVIVHSPQKKDHRVQLLQEIGLPFVIHGRVTDCEQSYSWVDFDNEGAFQQACKLLLDLGHRRIALINGPATLNFAWLRLKGYQAALAAADIPCSESLISNGILTELYGYETALSMLDMGDPPTAMIVSSYVVALGVKSAIVQAGLTVGNDISIIIHDDELSFFNNHGDVPQFTATRSPVNKAGEIAAQMLLDIIQQPHIEPQNHLLEARLTIGASTSSPAQPRVVS